MKMITKQEFVDIINRLRDYNDLQDKIDDLFKSLIDNKENDFCNAGSICIGHEIIVVRLLENMFDDTDILSWWLYECNYGRDFSFGDLAVDGVEIDLSTAEGLYDYLIQSLR